MALAKAGFDGIGHVLMSCRGEVGDQCGRVLVTRILAQTSFELHCSVTVEDDVLVSTDLLPNNR